MITFRPGPFARDRAAASRSIYSRETHCSSPHENVNRREEPLRGLKTPGFGGIDGVGQETTWYVP